VGKTLNYAIFSIKEKKVWAFDGKLILNNGMQTIIYKAFTNPHNRFIEDDLIDKIIKEIKFYRIMFKARFPITNVFIPFVTVLPIAPITKPVSKS
jgi:hypothetical protein